MKRAFLKSPMPFTRISSGFSNARYHPVLKEWRAHKGIDYAAPSGTPVRAIADSVVNFVGKQGGYGNLVLLNHQGNLQQRLRPSLPFRQGRQAGRRVSQGQVIGYVGATGLATGPHLHYEFRVGGVQKNPLALKLPTSYPLDARAKTSSWPDPDRPLLRSPGIAAIHQSRHLELIPRPAGAPGAP
jgi:murein DD-endopeptidase MepM/ murein hydrolase activator NlpD